MRNVSRSWLGPVTVFALAGLLGLGCSQEPTDPLDPPDMTTDTAVFTEKALALTLEDGVLAVRVPIGNVGARAVDGRVELVLEDLAGQRIARELAPFVAPPGGTIATLRLGGLPVDTREADLADYVLRYTINWQDGRARGARSAFDALDKLQVLLMTEGTVEEGDAQHVAVFVLDPATSKPIPRARLELALTAGAATRTALAETDASGHAALEVPLPEGASGEAHLRLRVVADRVTHVEDVPLQVVRSRKVLLTTDKPLYQPGQTVHVRALALQTHGKRPEAEQEATLEIEDAKGNKLTRELLRTDAFGIASATFPIARQVNLGTWKVRVTLGDTVNEKTIAVDRYVLPKFKVQAALDKTWYRPGAEVTVHGEARYFFGKPVAHGEVTVTAATFDVDFTTFASVAVRTDAEGRFSAKVQVPAHVVGLPLEQGKGLMKVDVAVRDGAQHTETASKTASIAKGAVDVALVPEGGRLIARVPNTLFVVTTDPDGGPVAAEVELAFDGDKVSLRTDSNGLGQVEVTPVLDGKVKVTVTAAGEKVSLDKVIPVGAAGETVLVRTDKAIYRPGDTAAVEVLVADTHDKVWLDLVHNGRTAMLETAPLVAGRATWQFDIDATLGGELRIGAWYVSDRGTLVRDQRMVFVQPNNELAVELTPRAETYRPGETATIDVRVKDKDGRGVAAAVGLQVVDEAVFALQESQPGLLKVFFELARELAAPVVSTGCGGCDATSIIRGDEAGAASYDTKAKLSFAALGKTALHGIEKDTFKVQVDAVKAKLKPRLDAERQRIVRAVGDRVDAGQASYTNIAAAFADAVFRDPWSQVYRVEVDAEQEKVSYTSNGPDERAQTADDLGFEIRFYEVLYAVRGWDDLDADFNGPPWAAAPEEGSVGGGGGSTSEGVKVRQDFPETLYVNPALITDGTGKAELSIALADSITTWRMSGLASSKDGLLGSGTGGINVFQDFFVDVDFPVAVTQNDVLRVPVAVYNYLPTTETVTLDLQPEAWFEAVGGLRQSVTLAPGEVRAAHFTLRALNVGRQGLTVLGRGSAKSDAVRRTVDVRPDGKAFTTTQSARFAASADGVASETVTQVVTIPAGHIAGSQELIVKVYPGFMSQVVEGMDSLLRLPGGCFEQTTSTAWPNVLATDYLAQTGALSEALDIKARHYITEGYQRLLTFECKSGGFNWWEGDDPGNAVLTAVGIMMFTDTKRVAFVDDQVIVRAARYLAQAQKADGSWSEERHLHAGNENLGAGSLRATAYITWALLHAGRESATAERALTYLRANAHTSDDVYTTALVALALAKKNASDPVVAGLVQALHDARIEEGQRVHWSPERQTMVGGGNDAGEIETTALVALALMEARAYAGDVGGALDWLVSKKDRQGNWGYSTQATVLTLKALIASLSAGAARTDATVKVLLDGVEVATRDFDTFNADVLWQVDLSDRVDGDHEVRLVFEGEGNLMWQVGTTHYLPWSGVEVPEVGPLAIAVDYDKTTLAVDDVIGVTVTVTNTDPNQTGMMMAELGLPPGFSLDTTKLDAVLGKGQVARYERTALRLVVYLEPIRPGVPVVFEYGLRATEPLEATAPESETYAYYNRAVRAETRPVRLVVTP